MGHFPSLRHVQGGHPQEFSMVDVAHGLPIPLFTFRSKLIDSVSACVVWRSVLVSA